MNKITRYIFLSVCFISCKDEYTFCDLPTAVRMKSIFYHTAGGIQRPEPVPFLTVTSISSPNADYSAAMLSEFSIALNPVADSVQYIVSIKEASIPDTITFVYTTRSVNVSAICGDVYINNLTKVSTTLNTLDSVKITNTVINTTSGENVRIYF